jgi:hypothetical protein
LNEAPKAWGVSTHERAFSMAMAHHRLGHTARAEENLEADRIQFGKTSSEEMLAPRALLQEAAESMIGSQK